MIGKYLIENYKIANVPEDLGSTGLISDSGSRSKVISFLDDKKYLNQIGLGVSALFVTKDYSGLVGSNILEIIVDDPRYSFYTLHNWLTKNKFFENSRIHPSARVGKSSYISENGVIIGANTSIGSNVAIYSGVSIGDNSIIQDGCVLGREGFEFKRTKNHGILHVQHDSELIISSDVVIGANSTIGRGVMHQNTIIEKECKIDFLVSIAHSAHIGSQTLIGAGAVICGRAQIGERVWLGPRSLISNGVQVGNDAHVSIGSVVMKNIGAGEKVWGFPARPFNFS